MSSVRVAVQVMAVPVPGVADDAAADAGPATTRPHRLEPATAPTPAPGEEAKMTGLRPVASR